MLNRQHRDALRYEVVDDEVLPRWNHQKWSRAAPPQAAQFRVDSDISHGRVLIGEALISNVLAPLPT